MTRHPPRSGCTIVGIGASAGGVEAITQVLENLTPDTGLAFVFVQHLSPTHESFLAEVLTPLSRVPVVQAAENMAIQPNRIHVIPPNVQLTVADGRLHLGPRPADRTQYNAIDTFFQSLAAQADHPVIAVVLSGSTSDGAIGLREVKAAGGVTIAQDPSTARYDAMPHAAIQTGAVDMVLAPRAIGQELVRLGTHPFLKAPAIRDVQDFPITDVQLEQLFVLLRGASGVDFSNYKLPTIKRRLQRRMALHKLTDFERYLKILKADPGEVRNLYRDILIHVTRFFRDPEAFTALRRTVLPRIVQDAAGKRPIRVWVPGCATGEEAYSVAILLLEYLEEDATSTPVQVFATDVSEEAIEKARGGVYPDSIEADVSRERLRRFFTRADGQYRIAKTVRDCCIFARQDLTRDPPFSKLDLIVCRNVLIYLGPRLQRKLITVFHYALKPSGYLMLGPTETVGGQGDLFAVVDRRQKIFTRRAGTPRMELDLSTLAEHSGTGVAGRGGPIGRHRPRDLLSEVTQLLLARYAPPTVVVDSDLQILHTRGRTGPFLELASGEVSLNLLKMTREGLLHGVRGAIQEARKTAKPARREHLVARANGTSNEVDVEVIPMTDGSEVLHFLIVFEARPLEVPDQIVSGKGPRTRSRANTRQLRLQQELTSNREYLQSVIQDLEAANEELQSANEEILSSNEELQSTNEELDTAKEELQSANEELNTVNEELNARNEELSQANSDLVNLLSAVPAAIVIVGPDLRIRRFTPMAEHVLNLIPTDIGRPLGDLKPNIDAQDLEDLARDVIDSVEVKELAVHDRTGRSYLLRIRPYKDQENRIDGAVLAFTDVPPSQG